MLWNNKVFSILVITCFISLGCRSVRITSKAHPLFNSQFVNFDKVKIEYSDPKQNFSARGFIRFKVDSSFCFQFWGPLGYEIIKGCSSKGKLETKSRIQTSFTFESLNNLSGISFNENMLQNLLLGKDSLFIDQLKSRNPSIVTVENLAWRGGRKVISIIHNISKKQLVVNFGRKKGKLESIELLINPDLLKINIQIGEISYNDKISNFEL